MFGWEPVPASCAWMVGCVPLRASIKTMQWLNGFSLKVRRIRTRHPPKIRTTRPPTMTYQRIPTPIYAYALAIILVHRACAQPVDLSAVGQQDMQIPVDVQMPQDQVVYDQRQNGTENLRVQMSGVTVLLAPAEALLSLAPQDIIDSGGAKPKSSHPFQTKGRLTNLLLGFLGKNHHN